MKILHLINTFRVGGGAQEMLRKLIASSGGEVSHDVITLLDNDAHDIPIKGSSRSLSIKTIKDLPRAVTAYRVHLRETPADVVLAWMYHSSLFAQAFTPREIPVVWNIRHSLKGTKREKLNTRFTIFACAQLSNRARKIIYCSKSAIANHEAVGFVRSKAVFIPNGFDLSVFRPYSPPEKARSREHFGLPSGAFIFGQAVRFHPMKNQAGLLQAFGDIARRDSGVHLVLAGRGMEPGNRELINLLHKEGLQGRVTLLGLQKHMADVFNCFDAYLSTSLWGEGFPNVIGEAMACGVPCIATAVGDSAEIVGPNGLVVECGESAVIAGAMMKMRSVSDEELMGMQKGARSRIAERYSIDGVRAMYNTVLGSVCSEMN